jgi:hypothetical protein
MAETDTYGFMAERDGNVIRVADNQGGGALIVADTREEAAAGIRSYMEGLIREFADEMVGDLFDDSDDEDD